MLYDSFFSGLKFSSNRTRSVAGDLASVMTCTFPVATGTVFVRRQG